MRYIILLLLSFSRCLADVIVANDGAGIVGPALCQPSDPRRLVVTDADFAIMRPLQDARGAPRWQYAGGVINYVDPTSRTALDPDRVRQAITDYLTARGWLREAQALTWDTTRPALYARIQAWVAERAQAVTDALRTGQASDDPVPPSKTTITPQ